MNNQRICEAVAAMDTFSDERMEAARSNVLKVLGETEYFFSEESKEEEAVGEELDMALKSMIDNEDTVFELDELIGEYHNAGRLTGFEAGFKAATKLFFTGMN
jgi:hypothetical protein